MKGRSVLVVALGAAVLTLLAWLTLRPEAVLVEPVTVKRGLLRVTVDEEGETRVQDRYVVAAPVSGRLLRSVLRGGDQVGQGEILARIEPQPLDPRTQAEAQARLAAAQAQERATDARLLEAMAALEQARRSVSRTDRLKQSGAISAEEYEQGRLDLRRREQDLEAARFANQASQREVEVARAGLMAGASGTSRSAIGEVKGCAPIPCVEVRAPVAGRVLRITEKSERVVVAGAPLLDLGDPSLLEIVIDVLSADAVKITPGARILIEDWGGDGPLEARVKRVEPAGFMKVSALGVEEQRVNVIGELTAPVAALGDGFRLETRTVIWEGESVLKVPIGALSRAGDEWAVFVLDGDRARSRSVEVGHRGGGEVEIREGLEENERVILHPSDKVADGVRVEPARRE